MRLEVGERGLVERCCELQASLVYPVRMKMIKVFGSLRNDPLSVSEVAETLRISQPAATKHLAILYRAGWIDRDEAGPRVHYLLNLGTYVEYRRLMDLAFDHARTPASTPSTVTLARSRRPVTEHRSGWARCMDWASLERC